LVFALSLTPCLWLLVRTLTDDLGVNPVETVTRETGLWGLRFLLATLAITPLRRLTGWNWLMRLRRMLGLYAFFYACLHMLTWLVLDHFFDWMEIGRDILKRSYITLGFAAFVLLIPLAATSTNGMMRRLGGRGWKRLHGTVYLIGVLAVMHFLWLVKADISDPAAYGAALALLLGLRFPAAAAARQHALAAAAGRPLHARGRMLGPEL
jgi:sulfoxide reductase heme-binding subunit YedZ